MELITGQVWWARPDTTVGREQSGRRPVVVVSGLEYLTTMTTLVLVVPVTTRDRDWPHHVRLTGRVALDVPSFAMTEQVRVISRERLVDLVGLVDHDCLDAVHEWLHDYLR